MKKLLGIVVLGLIFCGNVYSDIIDFKCLVAEQKMGDGNCNNCGKDDGLSIDLKNNKILVSPYFEDITILDFDKTLLVKNSNKFFDWVLPLHGHIFRFNKFTFQLDHRYYVTGMDIKTGQVKYPSAWVFKVLYKCKKIDPI